ncbi:uncharacterized protein LOC143905921 [Temnothorax americanus]
MGAFERRASSVKHVRITFAQDSKPYRFQRLDAIPIAMASDEASDITCGVCTATIVKKNIKSHQCVQQWHGITIESESQIFYPTNGPFLILRFQFVSPTILLSKKLAQTTTKNLIKMNPLLNVELKPKMI